MSSPSLTLQCRQCGGVFAAPSVDFSSLVQCPHCSTTAPILEFSAIQAGTRSTTPTPTETPKPEQNEKERSTPEEKEGRFEVRGKWLQFDCPHCVRPMRLIAEDAGGLVDCAHCGLELIAPDPVIGHGARLSRASEGRVGSLSGFNLRNLRGDQLKKAKSGDASGPFEEADEGDQLDQDPAEKLDPNHALVRSAAPTERKRAIKALESEQVGKSFRRQEVIAEQAIAASDRDWEPRPMNRPAFGESRQDRYGFWIALGLAAVVMIGIVAMVIREAGKSGEVFDDGQLSAIQMAQFEQKAQFQKSFEAAKAALASSTWEQLAAHVRQPGRVAQLMREFYEQVPYAPIEIIDFHAPVEVSIGELTMHEMKVTELGGATRTLVLDQTPDGSKVDWELMVNLPRHHWEQFLESRPARAQRVSVIASRSSVLDKYFDDAGIDRDLGIGVRLWHGTADNYFAVLPKESEMGRRMVDILEWDKGRKIIIEASFDPDSDLNDRLQIDGLIQTGWVIE